MKITTLRTETLLDTGRFKVHKGHFLRDSGTFGSTVERVWVDPGDAVAVLPINEHYFYLALQPREITGRTTEGLCAGLIDEDEQPGDAARRELMEEFGMRGSLELIGTFWTSEGFTTERTHIYLAHGAHYAAASNWQSDKEEAIKVRSYEHASLATVIDSIDNAKAMIALQALALRQIRTVAANTVPGIRAYAY